MVCSVLAWRCDALWCDSRVPWSLILITIGGMKPESRAEVLRRFAISDEGVGGILTTTEGINDFCLKRINNHCNTLNTHVGVREYPGTASVEDGRWCRPQPPGEAHDLV